MKILVIDTETGGLDPDKHSLLSVGAVVWSRGKILDEIEIIVRERALRLDPEAMAVTRFDLTQLKTRGQPPVEAAATLLQFLDRNFGPPTGRPKIPVAGHNVNFDVAFIRRLFKQARLEFRGVLSHRVLDTAGVLAFLILARRLPPSCATSSGAFAHFGIEFGPKMRHTALADARATATLLDRLIRSLDVGAKRPIR